MNSIDWDDDYMPYIHHYLSSYSTHNSHHYKSLDTVLTLYWWDGVLVVWRHCKLMSNLLIMAKHYACMAQLSLHRSSELCWFKLAMQLLMVHFSVVCFSSVNWNGQCKPVMKWKPSVNKLIYRLDLSLSDTHNANSQPLHLWNDSWMSCVCRVWY